MSKRADRVLDVLSVVLLCILLVNVSAQLLVKFDFPPAQKLYENGIVIRVPLLHRAFVFAHGGYDLRETGNKNFEFTPSGLVMRKDMIWAHYMSLDGTTYRTIDFVRELRDEGYSYVWGSWCQTGDHDFLEVNSTEYYSVDKMDGVLRFDHAVNTSVVLWSDVPYVDRNKEPGLTAPIFVGLGVYRLSVPE